MDDVYEMYPELKEQIMEDIKRDNWGTTIKDMDIYAEELRKEKEATKALEGIKSWGNARILVQ